MHQSAQWKRMCVSVVNNIYQKVIIWIWIMDCRLLFHQVNYPPHLVGKWIVHILKRQKLMRWNERYIFQDCEFKRCQLLVSVTIGSPWLICPLSLTSTEKSRAVRDIKLSEGITSSAFSLESSMKAFNWLWNSVLSSNYRPHPESET